MHEVLFKLALAVVLASAAFFLLSSSFSQLQASANQTSSNIEDARRAGMNRSVLHLQE